MKFSLAEVNHNTASNQKAFVIKKYKGFTTLIPEIFQLAYHSPPPHLGYGFQCILPWSEVGNTADEPKMKYCSCIKTKGLLDKRKGFYFMELTSGSVR